MSSLLVCVVCSSPDLRDLGVTRGAHIMVCRKCGEVMEKVVRLERLRDAEIRKSLVLDE